LDIVLHSLFPLPFRCSNRRRRRLPRCLLPLDVRSAQRRLLPLLVLPGCVEIPLLLSMLDYSSPSAPVLPICALCARDAYFRNRTLLTEGPGAAPSPFLCLMRHESKLTADALWIGFFHGLLLKYREKNFTCVCFPRPAGYETDSPLPPGMCRYGSPGGFGPKLSHAARLLHLNGPGF